MLGKKHILILTGEELTALSGLPSLRSYNRHKVCIQQEYLDIEKVINLEYFNDYTELTWRWLQEYMNIYGNCKPNKVH